MNIWFFFWAICLVGFFIGMVKYLGTKYPPFSITSLVAGTIIAVGLVASIINVAATSTDSKCWSRNTCHAVIYNNNPGSVFSIIELQTDDYYPGFFGNQYGGKDMDYPTKADILNTLNRFPGGFIPTEIQQTKVIPSYTNALVYQLASRSVDRCLDDARRDYKSLESIMKKYDLNTTQQAVFADALKVVDSKIEIYNQQYKALRELQKHQRQD